MAGKPAPQGSRASWACQAWFFAPLQNPAQLGVGGVSLLWGPEPAPEYSDVRVWDSVLPPEMDPSAGIPPERSPTLPSVTSPPAPVPCGPGAPRRGPGPWTWSLAPARWQSAAASPVPLRGPRPPTHWVLVLPACKAYARLVAWCLLFTRLFPLNFCSRLAHLAPGTCLPCVRLHETLHPHPAALPPPLPPWAWCTPGHCRGP